jgi:hypothetical protein
LLFVPSVSVASLGGGGARERERDASGPVPDLSKVGLRCWFKVFEVGLRC